MPDGTPPDEFLVPGRDPDPGARVEERLKIAWAVVGLFFTLVVFGFLLQTFGMTMLLRPSPRTAADYARLLAFVASCINVGIWMWFPVDDLQVLRRWVHTSRKIFPVNVAEFFAILLQTTLVLLLVVGTLAGPIWFGLSGITIYLTDLVGFQYIRRHVQEALAESRAVYSKQPAPVQTYLQTAADIISDHWACELQRPLHHRRQRRGIDLVFTFAAVTVIAVLGSHRPEGAAASYALGTIAIVLGEVSLASWRHARDRALHSIQETLRTVVEELPKPAAST